MKVFILTEGGRNIGFGHISRCGNLYRAFKENGHQPEFILNADESVFGLLTDKTYRCFNWLEEEEKLFSAIRDENIDVAVIDSYLAAADFFQRLARSVRLPVFLDDNKRMDYPSGIVLNWGIYADSLGYPKKENLTYLLGTRYLSLRDEFARIPHKEIKASVGSIMVTMGGDDSKNLTPGILKLLTETYPAVQKNIIIGKAYENKEAIQAVADENTRLIYYPDASGMLRVMLEADLAITSGGQTVYEMARVGLPAIGVATADNQLNNVRTWDRLGFIRYAGFWTDDALLDNIKRNLQLFEDKDKRTESSKAGQSQVTGNGEHKVVEAIQAHLTKSEPESC